MAQTDFWTIFRPFLAPSSAHLGRILSFATPSPRHFWTACALPAMVQNTSHRFPAASVPFLLKICPTSLQLLFDLPCSAHNTETAWHRQIFGPFFDPSWPHLPPILAVSCALRRHLRGIFGPLVPCLLLCKTLRNDFLLRLFISSEYLSNISSTSF